MSIVFKPYLQSKSKYKGGKGKADVASKVGSKKLYKLSSNENMLGTSPKAAEAIRKAIPELFYYPERTDVQLRKALEQFYDNKIDESDFMCANSAMELLDGICRAFLYEGDNAIACQPAFRAYKLFTGKSGADLINIPLIGDDFNIDIEGILDAVNDKTKL
ncbi:MAG: aminotransferase class I/II-fold pyridoxal phosphate-dependent enzyme, partial [Saprospiraceae bacterium]|nr:aminotransferase class I/II-fold pyridoxal phosphate-dependent enzyme [Saprospiraceae bacterium]